MRFEHHCNESLHRQCSGDGVWSIRSITHFKHDFFYILKVFFIRWSCNCCYACDVQSCMHSCAPPGVQYTTVMLMYVLYQCNLRQVIYYVTVLSNLRSFYERQILFLKVNVRTFLLKCGNRVWRFHQYFCDKILCYIVCDNVMEMP